MATRIGTPFEDLLKGGPVADVIKGLGGDDFLTGGAGRDTILGGADDDEIDGGDGDDTVKGGAGEDKLSGGAGDDRLFGGAEDDRLDTGAGADLLNGGSGDDFINYANSASAVTIDLRSGVGSGGDAEGDTLKSIEFIAGSSFADTLIGDGARNAFLGGAGGDVLDGGDGIDTLIYFDSTARIVVDLGSNKASGGSAEGDVISNIENLFATEFADVLRGSDGDNLVSGGEGRDTIWAGGGNDKVEGGGGNDTIDGGTGDDTIRGDDALSQLFGDVAGNDLLRGGGGNDHLDGESGNDVLSGGSGDDVLFGGDGRDRLTGKAGEDRFVLADDGPTDIITDFHHGEDAIAIDASTFRISSKADPADLIFIGARGDVTGQGFVVQEDGKLVHFDHMEDPTDQGHVIASIRGDLTGLSVDDFSFI